MDSGEKWGDGVEGAIDGGTGVPSPGAAKRMFFPKIRHSVRQLVRKKAPLMYFGFGKWWANHSADRRHRVLSLGWYNYRGGRLPS